MVVETLANPNRGKLARRINLDAAVEQRRRSTAKPQGASQFLWTRKAYFINTRFSGVLMKGL
jgi:hypothetical protein